MEGVVDSWDFEGRYGKLKKHTRDKKWYFVHYKNILDGDSLSPGQKVTFYTKEVWREGQKPQEQAVDVRGGFWSKSLGHLHKSGLTLQVRSAIVQELLSQDFADAEVKVATYPVGGYSKLNDGSLVEFQPPTYVPSKPPYKLERDQWNPGSCQAKNGIYETISQILPASQLENVDILTDRNNLMKLLDFLDCERQITSDRFVFQIDAERKNGILVLTRVDLDDPVTGLPINHVLGHGFAFEGIVTKAAVPETQKHVIIQHMDLDGLTLLVRCEVDAADPTDQRQLIEIKTGNAKYRSTWDGWKKVAIQMQFGGSAKLIIGWHDKGSFQEAEEVLTFPEVQQKARGYDKKFAALASLLRKVMEMSKAYQCLDLVYSPPSEGLLASSAKLSVSGESMKQMHPQCALPWYLLPSGRANYVQVLGHTTLQIHARGLHFQAQNAVAS